MTFFFVQSTGKKYLKRMGIKDTEVSRKHVDGSEHKVQKISEMQGNAHQRVYSREEALTNQVDRMA